MPQLATPAERVTEAPPPSALIVPVLSTALSIVSTPPLTIASISPEFWMMFAPVLMMRNPVASMVPPTQIVAGQFAVA